MRFNRKQRLNRTFSDKAQPIWKMLVLVLQRNQRFLPTPYPPYLFSLITSSFQVAAWAMKLTKYTQTPAPSSAWDQILGAS